MHLYWRLWTAFAVYIGITKDFGIKPIWHLEKFGSELIVELPYTSIVMTPAKILRAQQNKTKSEIKPDEKRDRGLSTTPAGATKN